MREDEKRRFDVLHAWWCLERGEDLSQWDAFSILLAHYLEHVDRELPEAVRVRLA